MECDHCGRQMDKLSHTCSKCGEEFCTEHRLPESHDCMGLKLEKAERALKREEGDEVPWFDDNVSGGGESDNTTARVERKVSGTSSTTQQTTNPDHTQQRTEHKERETRRDELEKERKEQYSSPDVNLDGSLDEPKYEEDIASLSADKDQGEKRGKSNRLWLTVLVVVLLGGLIFAVIFLA